MDVLSGSVLVLVALAMLAASLRIEKKLAIGVGSGFAPKIVAVGLICMGAVIAFNGWRGVLTEQDRPNILRSGRLATLATFLLIGSYIVLVNQLGFLVSTTAFLIAQFAVLAPPDDRRWLLFAIVSPVSSLIIYVVFERVFGLILPAGIL